MISLAMPMAIWSFFLLWSQRALSVIVDRGSTKMRSQTFFDINIAFVRAIHCGQLERSINFSRLLLSVLESILTKAFVEVVNPSITLVEFVGAYHWPVFIT